MLAPPFALALALTNQPPAPAPEPARVDEPADAPASADVRAPETAAETPAPAQPPAAPGDRSPAPGAPPSSAGQSGPAAAKEPAAPPARPRWWGPDPRPKVSGYGGPALRLSGLHGAFAALVGLEGGINILQRLTVGASLLWLLNPVDAKTHAVGTATRLGLNYGGLVVDVAYARGKRLAGTLGGLLGGGGACVQDPNNGQCADRLGFFVGEPRAGLRVVLAPIVRLHLAFGWRLVAARAWDGPRALGGPSGALTLEFGLF